MENGICPKCASTEVHSPYLKRTPMHLLGQPSRNGLYPFKEYICVDCGYTELYALQKL